MIDQKLGIYTEHLIQDLLIRDTAPCHVTHGRQACCFQLLRVPSSDTPEVRERRMVPQLPAVTHFIQLRDPHAVPVRGSLLRHDVHGDLGKIKIRPDTGSSRDPGLLQNLPHHLHGKLMRGQIVNLQIVRRVDKNFINGIHMNVFRGDIAKIDLVDPRTVFDVQRHAGSRSDKIKLQGRIRIQLRDIIRFPGKLSRSAKPHTVDLLHLPKHFKEPRPSRNPERFQRRGHSKTDRLRRPGHIRHDKIRSQRIQAPLSCLHRCIKRFQINRDILPHPHTPPLVNK